MTSSDSSLSPLSEDDGIRGSALPADLSHQPGTRGRRRFIDRVLEQQQSQPPQTQSSQVSSLSSVSDVSDIHDSEDPRGHISNSSRSAENDGEAERFAPSTFDEALAQARSSMIDDLHPNEEDDQVFEGPGRRIMETVDREDEGWVVVYEGLKTGVPLWFDQSVREICGSTQDRTVLTSGLI